MVMAARRGPRQRQKPQSSAADHAADQREFAEAAGHHPPVLEQHRSQHTPHQEDERIAERHAEAEPVAAMQVQLLLQLLLHPQRRAVAKLFLHQQVFKTQHRHDQETHQHHHRVHRRQRQHRLETGQRQPAVDRLRRHRAHADQKRPQEPARKRLVHDGDVHRPDRNRNQVAADEAGQHRRNKIGGGHHDASDSSSSFSISFRSLLETHGRTMP